MSHIENLRVGDLFDFGIAEILATVTSIETVTEGDITLVKVVGLDAADLDGTQYERSFVDTTRLIRQDLAFGSTYWSVEYDEAEPEGFPYDEYDYDWEPQA